MLIHRIFKIEPSIATVNGVSCITLFRGEEMGDEREERDVRRS
jgi:hypothetical protein